MEITDLKKISISNLILIILNDKNTLNIRKFAEIELRKRIKNIGWDYDDLLHCDDKVIKKRGLDINNYLISPNVDMQQLMETYFKFSSETDENSNYLLFSEKHLCNETNFAEPFFSRICNIEIRNINKRIKKMDNSSEKHILLSFRKLLIERHERIKQEKKIVFDYNPIDLLCYNDVMEQLNSGDEMIHEFLYNYSEEQKYQLTTTKLGRLKAEMLELLNDTLCDYTLVQYLCGLNFIEKDNFKLNKQKRKLLQQARNGFEVNYEAKLIQRGKHRL